MILRLAERLEFNAEVADADAGASLSQLKAIRKTALRDFAYGLATLQHRASNGVIAVMLKLTEGAEGK